MLAILRGFIRTAFRDAAIYRIDFWLGLLSVFFVMYAIASIWSILYQQSPGAFGVDRQQMITYGVLGILLGPIMWTTSQTRSYIASQVRSGSIEIDLMKPLDFMLHMLARNLGELCVMVLLRAVPGFLFARLVLGLQLPPDLGSAAAFAVSVALGYLVYFGLNFLIGLLALVTADVRSYTWAYNSLVRFASGEAIPLWLFPPVLGTLLYALPFQAIYFVPMSIYIGAQPGNIGWALAGQALWVLAVLLVCRVVWARAQRRIVVQGG
jgi:ABC-2 type transport system permease protein